MSKDYSKYEIEDFAFDESFQKWVFEEQTGQPGFWEKFIVEHPYQTDKILAARALVQQLKALETDEPYADLMEEVWENVEERIGPAQRTFWATTHWWRIAASVVLVVGTALGLYLFSNIVGVKNSLPRQLASQGDQELAEEVNRTDNAVTIHLSDGSVVTLTKNSRLIYPKNFGSKERTVQLDGEAFFEVAKDANRPFLIYAKETVTKVLGTSFRIQAFEEQPKVTVSVTTGKVSVFTRKELEQSATPRGVILTANLQAEFSRDGQQLYKTIVSNPAILPAERKMQFDFSDTPLSQVFDSLQAAYGIDIIYDQELVKDRTLHVSMDNESLYEKLQIVCNTMGLSYQIVDAKVIIEKKNLNQSPTLTTDL